MKLIGLELGFKYISTILKGSEHALILRFPSVRGISFLKTVNTLQVALQKHKGGDRPSKHEVHLQRCQESPREHMPHNRGISGHRRYPPKAHLDSLGCKSLSDPNCSIAAG